MRRTSVLKTVIVLSPLAPRLLPKRIGSLEALRSSRIRLRTGGGGELTLCGVSDRPGIAIRY